MSNLIQDLKYAFRMMGKNPGFATVAVLTLALGIGANTTIFTWVNGFLLNGFPGVPDADRLLIFSTAYRNMNNSVSYPDFEDFRSRADKLDIVAMNMEAMSLKVGDEAERIWGKMVTGNYFDALGIRMAMGRGFTPDEWKTRGTHPVVVISHALWQRKFAGDRNIVGRVVLLNNTPFTVVGVAPEGFRGTYVGLMFDAYVPMQMYEKFAQAGGNRLEQRGNHWMDGLAKLKPGVSASEAQAQLNVISKQLGDAYPDTNREMLGTLYSLWKSPYGATNLMGPVLMILSGVVGLVLLIACANVANLLLARATARRKEIAIRMSLGASRSQLIRQLLTESLLLSLMGGALAVTFAYWSWDLLLAFMPSVNLPIAAFGRMDWQTMGYTFALSLLTGLIFGLAPALEASRKDVVTTLKDETAGVVGGGKGRLRNSLVVAQVSLSLLLLISSGLLLRSLFNAQSIRVGFEPKGVWIGSMDLFPAGYTPDTGREFQKQLMQRITSLPGVNSAGLSRFLPLGFGGSSTSTMEIEGYVPPKDQSAFASYNFVTPDYFRTMGIEMVNGRDFNAQDSRNGQPVAVVNEAMVQRYWKDREPLGGRIQFGGQWLNVIGVVRTHKYRQLNEQPRPYMYIVMDQFYRPDFTLMVRTSGDPGALTASIRSVLRGLDAGLPLFNVTTLDESISAATFTQRLGGYMLGVFGGLALVLAAIGIYGVMSFSVSQRTREIGIRMALGAERKNIFAMVLRQGALLIGVGLAIGLTIAFAAANAIKAILLNVSARDPLTFAAVPLVLAAVALVATYLPARRATRVDPLIALRYE